MLPLVATVSPSVWEQPVGIAKMIHRLTPRSSTLRPDITGSPGPTSSRDCRDTMLPRGRPEMEPRRIERSPGRWFPYL
ncbi:hypothetical protein TSAR_010030 [Trichomalopsis sarcophagae]|uniref:Uncharacterized protein n=1 Tax=Trichomalopsis sarcophagae TaxID=543379 RepID=A0A232F181_9HYME|nr:hypothetical protein TSAR_010030 [Trichomalopsis sarcophagae]